jgi:hypothetical protein
VGIKVGTKRSKSRNGTNSKHFFVHSKPGTQSISTVSVIASEHAEFAALKVLRGCRVKGILVVRIVSNNSPRINSNDILLEDGRKLMPAPMCWMCHLRLKRYYAWMLKIKWLTIDSNGSNELVNAISDNPKPSSALRRFWSNKLNGSLLV